MAKKEPPPMKPLVPPPVISIIALALTGIMFYVIFRDADPTSDYNGGPTILLLSTLVGGIVGVPIGVDYVIRARRRDSDDESEEENV